MQPVRRTLEAFSLLIGALALISTAFASTAAAAAGETGQPDRDGTIHQDLPIAAGSFQSEGDCGTVTEGTAWHFVLNHTTVDTAGSTLTATFEDAGSVTVQADKVTDGTTHYYVGTADGDVLTGASVSTGDGQLQLSHVCDAPEVDDEETEPVTCPDEQMPVDHDDDESTPDECMPASNVEDCPDDQIMGDHDDDESTPDECMPEQAEDDKIEICHATGNGTYVLLEIAKEGLNGHLDHQDGMDIIPAFDGFAGQPVGQGPVTEADCVSEVDDDEDEPTVELTSVEIECVGATAETILFDLEAEGDATTALVSLTDDADADLGSTTVTLTDGVANGSLAYPTAFTGTLLLAVDYDGVTADGVVPASTCGTGGSGFIPEVDVKIPEVDVKIPEVDVEIPEVDVETPEVDVETPEVDVEGEGVENIPTPTITKAPPAVAPTVVDQPVVMGDTVTRTAVGGGQLPRTGASAAGLVPFGLTLIAAGFALKRSGRRASQHG